MERSSHGRDARWLRRYGPRPPPPRRTDGVRCPAARRARHGPGPLATEQPVQGGRLTRGTEPVVLVEQRRQPPAAVRLEPGVRRRPRARVDPSREHRVPQKVRGRRDHVFGGDELWSGQLQAFAEVRSADQHVRGDLGDLVQIDERTHPVGRVRHLDEPGAHPVEVASQVLGVAFGRSTVQVSSATGMGPPGSSHAELGRRARDPRRRLVATGRRCRRSRTLRRRGRGH